MPKNGSANDYYDDDDDDYHYYYYFRIVNVAIRKILIKASFKDEKKRLIIIRR